ncbi:contactin [Galendromus occidentalis]|uniref:Contactin n=1 Tax=Galendromus occidentalis TaxID=34638 RepID=A0AAJ7WIV1_9ACAR|nr:contactin [Galendromus occidentalis]
MFLILTFLPLLVLGQDCPRGWLEYSESCYKFVRSPQKTREDARDLCAAYSARLVSVNTFDELQFIIRWLRANDPQHRRWWTSGYELNGAWSWDGDGSYFSNIDQLWLPDTGNTIWNYAAYSYSSRYHRWGLERASPTDQLALICEIFKENLHQIILQERTIDYGVIELDPLRIPHGPYFSREPKDVIFDQSGRSQVDHVSLRCVASGYPTPTYKWYREVFRGDDVIAREIDPLEADRFTQTDGTLIISHPEPNIDRGKYHCIAENVFGRVKSRTATLGFGYIGEFNKKRAPDTGREYWGKSIACDEPQHYPKVNYYWTRNSFPNFVEEDRRVFVSHDAHLYFSSLEKIDNGNYSCNVQSDISDTGRTGPFFPVIVEPGSSGQKLLFPNNFPKSFPQTILAGDRVRLECIAYGYPVPRYNWTRVNGDLPYGSYVESHERVLIIPKVRVEDEGEYVCSAITNQQSIQKSHHLSVQALPEFTIPLENQIFDEGATLTWECEAFGIPDISYEWYYNGRPLNDTSNLHRLNRYIINENILIINQVARGGEGEGGDEGMYQCMARNQIGSAFSSAQLKVISLMPNFWKYPLETELYAAEEGNLTISCRPEAAPFPEFLWKKDGYNVGTSGGGRVYIMPNGFLRINPVRIEDEGNYTCIAKNIYGQDMSSGRLIVLPPPIAYQSPPPRLSAVVNDTVTLLCEAKASPLLDLSYTWTHNDLKIDWRRSPLYETKYSMPEAGNLVIYNVTFAEAGFYKCIAKTSIGRVEMRTELIVIGPPGPVGAIKAENANETSALLSWTDSATNGRHFLGYLIEGRTNHNHTWRLIANYTTGDRFRLEAPFRAARRAYQLPRWSLSPYSGYEFRIAAYNDLGIGEFSEPSPVVTTQEDRPYNAPNNVGGGGGKAGSLTVTWEQLHTEDWNAPQVWYIVYWRPASEKGEFNKQNLKEYGNVGLHVVNVGEENYFRPYTVMVQAMNYKGAGPTSREVEVYSAEARPEVQPTGVYAHAYNSTALNVTWTPLDVTREKIRGRLIGHRIKYWRSNADAEVDFLVLLNRGLRNWALVVGLQPNTEYRVAVMAYNDAGSGPESEYFIQKTWKAAPLRPPTSVKVRPISDTSVKVTWRGVVPSIEEESIQGYMIRYWEADQDYTQAREVRRILDIHSSELDGIVSDLVPGKVYKLRVLAYSLGGDGKMSSPPWEFRLGDGVQSSLTSSSLKFVSSILTLLFGLLICRI